MIYLLRQKKPCLNLPWLHPVYPMPCPALILKKEKNDRGFNYVVQFPEKVRFPNEEQPKQTVWFNVNREGSEGEAEDAA